MSAKKRSIKAWLDLRTPPTIECPACKKAGWDIGEHLVELPVRTPGRHVLGGTVYPQAQLICITCGFTMLFNAVKMGIIGSDEEEAKKTEASQKEVSNG